MQIILKDGLVYQAGQLNKLDVLVEDENIRAIGKNLDGLINANTKVFDVSDKLVSPGLVDVHVHYREPGFDYKETIATGTLAAAHGGYTTVCAMPNLNPVPDTPEKIKSLVSKNKEDGFVHIKQYSSITKGLKSEELVDFEAMKNAGAFAFSNDGTGVQKAGIMYQAMKKAAELDMPIVAHVEDDSLLFGGVMNEGKIADKLGLPGILGISESSQIARDLLLAQKSKVHYHVCHVSTKESVELIRLAKKHGINVTCEVSPHHLLLNEEDIIKDDGYYKMNPPLRSRKDQQALIEGLKDGTIDMIATDHAPHSKNEKNKGILNSSFGITGSETAFSLLYTKFVKKNIFTLEELITWMSLNPAKKFNFIAGQLIAGAPADIAVFDLENQTTIKESEYLSKGVNTPFTNQKVYGQTVLTLVSGKVKYFKEV